MACQKLSSVPVIMNVARQQREFGVDSAARLAHVTELLSVVKSIDSEPVDVSDADGRAPPSRLAHLLQHLTLMSDVDAVHKAKAAAGSSADKAKPGGSTPVVTLSTVHAAKGMEWDVVFVVGVEASLFPHARSVVADDDKAKDAATNKTDSVDEVTGLWLTVTTAEL